MVEGLGFALADNDTAIGLGFDIASITPPGGSWEGGTELLIQGFGFRAGAPDRHTVTLTLPSTSTTVNCIVKSATTRSLNCTVDTSIAAYNSPEASEAARVSIKLNGLTAACRSGASCTYTFSSASTPNVTSVTPASAAPGAQLVVRGTGLLPGATTFFVGMDNASIVAHTNTSVAVITAPVMTAGRLSVWAQVQGFGNSASGAIFSQTLAVITVSNSIGSVVGGLPLTLTGYGFPRNLSRVTVLFNTSTARTSLRPGRVLNSTGTTLLVLTPPARSRTSATITNITVVVQVG
jgi:hypothetical protein